MSTTQLVADREERLRELPPSAKLVAKVLEYDGDGTQGELAEESLLPPRTVRYALGRLEEAGIVESRYSFADARKRIYSLRTGDSTADRSGGSGSTLDRLAEPGSTSDPLSERL